VTHLDTWDTGFFDRAGKVTKIHSGPQAGMYFVTARMDAEPVILPVAQPFAGKVVLLVGGENSSAGFQFANLVQQAKAAILIGQPTGGNLRGINGGEIAWVTLPNSGVGVDIPLLAGTYSYETPDRPVIPDVVVHRHFEAQRAGVDEELQAALQRLSE